MKSVYNFSEILTNLTNIVEFKARRRGWNGNGMWIEIQRPDEHSKMTHPYLVMCIPNCEEGLRRLPWQPAQVDLFAEDWSLK